MYECLVDNCPHPKSKYHFQALRTLVLAHHMQVAALQSFHLELESILLFCAIIHFTLIAALQSLQSEFHTICLFCAFIEFTFWSHWLHWSHWSHLQDLKDVTSHTHYENYRTGKLTAMMKSGEVAIYNF